MVDPDYSVKNFTGNLKYSQNAEGECDWTSDAWRNQFLNEVINQQSMRNNAVVSGGNLTGPTGLDITIDETVVVVGGTQFTVSSDTITLYAGSATVYKRNWIYVNSSGTLIVAENSPPTDLDFVMIELIDTNTTSIFRRADLRQNISPGARTDAVNEWTAQQYIDGVALVEASPVAWDLDNQAVTLTLTANRTMDAPTNLKNVGFYTIDIIQTTGSHTIAWNAIFKFINQTAPTLSTAAGAKDTITFKSDGVNLKEVGRALNNG